MNGLQGNFASGKETFYRLPIFVREKTLWMPCSMGRGSHCTRHSIFIPVPKLLLRRLSRSFFHIPAMKA